MKRYSVMWITACLLLGCIPASAQTFAEWFSQKKTQKKYLIQQIVKLQLYLAYTRKGYDVVNKGLTTIGRIKDGDYRLHDLFFNDRYVVKPVIKNYSKAEDCRNNINEIKEKVNAAKQLLSGTEMFNSGDKDFLEKQIDNMMLQLLEDVKALNNTLSDNALQMSDNQRLTAIDKIYQSVVKKKEWIMGIYDSCTLLSNQRETEIKNLDHLKQIHSIK